MRKRTQARECALQILYQYEMNSQDARTLIKEFWIENPGMDPDVRVYTERLVLGTLEHLKEIDEVLTRHAENWLLARMAVIDRNILRFAAYELLYLIDEIPPKVCINEAVNIAKKYSQEEAGKFVNGILDKINHTERAQKAGPGAAGER
ncbi:MAG: transcription antitermination factor NusB [Omnitrophica bacterium GWA2_52_12]|nr:MAG: transcription antitermination factor NusB [Omnitrophica bacterium GWA2_52_12]